MIRKAPKRRSSLQVILGAGGGISEALTRALPRYAGLIRLVARSPRKVTNHEQVLPMNLLDPEFIPDAIRGSDVVYLTVGIRYRSMQWKKRWPLIMRNVLDACIKTKSKLVFFDNVDVYDRRHMGHITEDTPIRPTSRKGRIRLKLSEMLMEEVEKGRLEAMIVRSADFYGARIEHSMVVDNIYRRFRAGDRARWFGPLECRHSCTHVWDAGRAMALLGNTPEAYNQVWHLPTRPNPPTGREWIELFARHMEIEDPEMLPLNRWQVALMGLHKEYFWEVAEMMYQYEQDFIFDSSKFMQKYPTFLTTSYENGVEEIVRMNALYHRPPY